MHICYDLEIPLGGIHQRGNLHPPTPCIRRLVKMMLLQHNSNMGKSEITSVPTDKGTDILQWFYDGVICNK